MCVCVVVLVARLELPCFLLLSGMESFTIHSALSVLVWSNFSHPLFMKQPKIHIR